MSPDFLQSLGVIFLKGTHQYIMRAAFLISTLFVYISLFSQNTTISGYVKDASSGEALIGATIYSTKMDRGTSTNNYGFYSLSLSEGDSSGLVFSYLGYASQIKKVNLDEDIRLDVELLLTAKSLDEVVVEAGRLNENIRRPVMGVVDIPLDKLSELPVILGETDVLKVVQLLPGVQRGNEGTTGFHVRGGNIDQNLVQLDEATVYNPNHLFGLFSTFNSRALNNVTLIKGGFPADYGGRLSSILDITMKEGNNRRLRVHGGIGLISSQLTVEGPIKKEISSFIVSGRRTYMDWLVKPFLPKGNKSTYRFYDINAKVNWKLSDSNRLFASFFQGDDDAEYREAQGINYQINFGNTTGTLRWNHIFSSKLFSNVSLIYNNYDQNIAAIQDNSFSQVFSGINDWSVKGEFQYSPSIDHFIKFGIQYTNHEFSSSGTSAASNVNDPSRPLDIQKIPSEYFSELALYLNDEITISEVFSVSLGVRAPWFISRDVDYLDVEPRLTMNYKLDDESSLKGSYTIMNQFLHLIPSSTAAVPTDIWIPSTARTKPQFSQQWSLGYFRNIDRRRLEVSIELYYKDMKNQALFREGNQLVESLSVDSVLVYGQGWSYGAELFIRKNTGRFTGWASYTLSWSNQKFPDLNFGREFPFRYDRRHNLAIVGSYDLDDRWSLSTIFTITSGNVQTLPDGRISVFQGGTLFEGNYQVYTGRNNFRLDPYHRLDVSLTHKRNSKLFGNTYEAEWVFGFYNIYSRQNPYFIYYRVDPITNKPGARQVSLLPIIPSFSYNFSF